MHIQIEKQRHLAKNGYLHDSIANQKSYEIEDLILAIAASNRLDFFSGHSTIEILSLEIYLHDFSREEIEISVNKLIESSLIEKCFLYPKTHINITGYGFQQYLAQVRLKLKLDRNTGILSPILPTINDDRFEKLGFDKTFN